MDARELENKMGYIGMEKSARKILMNEKLAKPEEVAVMSCIEVCEKLLETYDVVCCDDEEITIVRREDMEFFYSITKKLCR